LMAPEPASKRTIAFFDGQNLFHAARQAFGHTYPSYDPHLLAAGVCAMRGWDLAQVRFYTGVPARKDDPFWHDFWTNKLAHLRRRGAAVYSRPLVYREQVARLPDGRQCSFLSGEEKGIDVRIAIDVINLAWQSALDVALIFSQDQDLSEVAREIREIARSQSRWIKAASAFPVSQLRANRKGINCSDWIRIDRAAYDACLDPKDYRPKKASTSGETP